MVFHIPQRVACAERMLVKMVSKVTNESLEDNDCEKLGKNPFELIVILFDTDYDDVKRYLCFNENYCLHLTVWIYQNSDVISRYPIVLESDR